MTLTTEQIDTVFELINNHFDKDETKASILAIIKTKVYRKHLTESLLTFLQDPHIAIASTIGISIHMGILIGYEIGHKEALREMLEGK